jgi:UDP-N-acetylmuramate: L-alanyl-gamma-D-glutamyl-meso-diaminopimelate ligase
LALADQVVVAGVHRAGRYRDDERLDVNALVSSIRAAGRGARHLPDAEAIVAGIVPELCSGDVVALLSNGGFGGIYDKLPIELERRFRRA